MPSVREAAKIVGNGHVDILINNAGIFPFDGTHQTTEEIAYSLNVKAPFFLVAELAPLMAKNGKGAIAQRVDYGRRLRAVDEPLWINQEPL